MDDSTAKYLEGAFLSLIEIVVHLIFEGQLHLFPVSALFEMPHSFLVLQTWAWF